MKKGNHMSKDRFHFVMTALPLWLSQAKCCRNTVWDERVSDDSGRPLRKILWGNERKKQRNRGERMEKLVWVGFSQPGASGELWNILQWLAWMATPGSPCLWEKAALDEGFCSLENKQQLTCPILGSKPVSVSQGCCNKMSHIYLWSYSSRGSVSPIRALIGFVPFENFTGRTLWKPVLGYKWSSSSSHSIFCVLLFRLKTPPLGILVILH